MKLIDKVIDFTIRKILPFVIVLIGTFTFGYVARSFGFLWGMESIGMYLGGVMGFILFEILRRFAWVDLNEEGSQRSDKAKMENKITKILWMFIGVFLGGAISNFIWYFRLSQDKMLRELIFYLNEGSIDIFLTMGSFPFIFFIILLMIVIYIENSQSRENKN